jgi:predicted MFS family arabinose efflux permease
MQTNGTQPFDFPLLHVLKARSFWLIMFILLLFAGCLWFIFIHLVPHITDMGYSSITAASIISLMGIAVTVGKVLGGIMSDRIGRKSAAIFCTLGLAVSMLWLVWAKELWMLYLFALVFGYANGGLSSSLGAIVGTTFELDNIGVIWGALDIGYAIGAAVGPALGGFIFDVANSYSFTFLLCSVAMIITTALILLVKPEKHATKTLTSN